MSERERYDLCWNIEGDNLPGGHLSLLHHRTCTFSITLQFNHIYSILQNISLGGISLCTLQDMHKITSQNSHVHPPTYPYTHTCTYIQPHWDASCSDHVYPPLLALVTMRVIYLLEFFKRPTYLCY